MVPAMDDALNVPSPVAAPDAAFTLPSDVAGGDWGAGRGEQRTALGIVHGLMRVAPRDPWSLDDAVAALEVILFVVPAMDEEDLERGGGGGCGAGGGGLLDDAVGAALESAHGPCRSSAARARARRTRRGILCSDRAAPAAVARTLRVMCA